MHLWDSSLNLMQPLKLINTVQSVDNSSPILYQLTLINYINVVANERINCPTSNSMENKRKKVIYLPLHDDFTLQQNTNSMVPLRDSPTYFYKV